MDVNTHLMNLNYSLHYQRVIKGPLLFNAGIFGGKFGEGNNYNDTSIVYSGHNLGIAYPMLNPNYSDTSGLYELGSTATIGYGLGVNVGIGLFKEFRNYHGIRFNLNQRFGWMLSDVRSSYYRPDKFAVHHSYNRIWHPVGAVSIELYHTVRFTGRSTFYWGFKMPYYYTLDKGRFNPKKDSEVFHKLLFDLSVGMTYAIGKCD